MQEVKPSYRTFFYRCEECGSEWLNTIDLDIVSEPPDPPDCHCGGAMKPAGIPRLVIPEPGGDGHTYEVEELKR
jgi:hypothetical protein